MEYIETPRKRESRDSRLQFRANSGSSFQVEREQFGQKLFIAERWGPAVGGEDGGVEPWVGEVEPGGALVIWVRNGNRREQPLSMTVPLQCLP